MSNANRDYAIVYDVKNSLLVLSRPLNFYLTDKNTSNIFVKLVTRVIVGDGIDQYTDIENASSYVLTMRVIKPDDEVKSIIATQHESESIFQFDLTEDFKDVPGKYICELTISNIVNGRQEFTTSDPFNYEVKRSILSNIKNIIEGKDTTVEKLLNDLDATKAELSSQIKVTTNNIQQQLNNLVLGAVGDGNNAEVIQARGYNTTLKENMDRIEKGKYPFDDTATLLYNNQYLDNSCIKFLQLINVDITKDYYVRFISNYTFNENTRRFAIVDSDGNWIFQGVYSDTELYTGIQFGTLVNGKQKCIFIIDWSKVNLPFVNYDITQTKISKTCINNETYPVLPKYCPAYDFIKDIKLFGVDKSKIYAIHKIQKSVSNATMISIFDVLDNKIVCSFNKYDVDIDKTAKYIELAEENNSGISGRAYINWDGLEDGFNYLSNSQTLGLYLISDLCYGKEFKLSHFEDDLGITSKPIDVLPINKIYSVYGTETNFYFKNVIKGFTDNLIFNKAWGTTAELRKDFLRNKGNISQNENEKIGIYLNNADMESVGNLTFTNIACEKSVGSNVTKKCIFIGDSITDRGVYLTELKRLFDNDVMNIEFVGTQGNEIKHEGRSSWGSYDFISSQEYAGRTNTFYNPSTSAFDFSYYINNNSFQVDWVFIMLGTNDTWRPMNGKTTADYVQQMIDSIHSYSSDIKIGVALIIPPYIGKLSSTTGDKSSLINKNNHFDINKGLLKQFKGKESNNIYIVPITAYIDAENNFVMKDEQINSRNTTMTKVCEDEIHPANSGYYQIADGFYTFIKNNL